MSSSASDLRHLLAGSGSGSGAEGFHGAIREAVDLAPLTHVRIGGPAELFIEPQTEGDVGRVVRAARELGLPLQILGGGSNLLVADRGVPGITMSLAGLHRVMRDGVHVTAGAGVTLPSLIRGTKDVGLAGLELLIGVPALVGGAVAMNAGTRDTETFRHLSSLTVVDETGELAVLGPGDFHHTYRDGGLGDKILVQATFTLVPDDPQAIFRRMSASLKRRNATQPVTERSVGCVFRNPEKDVLARSAGRLIEEAGCKTMRRGKIVISGKHANYFVNEGGGTSRQFLDLMRDVQDAVEQQFGVRLVPEVKIWGM